LVDCIHEYERILVIDPEECIDFPEDSLPDKWEPFVKINYAFPGGADVINPLVDEYVHNVQNPPLEAR
jgi:hypothetical protein